MPRTHGYTQKGLRCYGKRDWNAKGRTNVIGALLGTNLIIASLFQGNINSQIFKQWLVDDLIPILPEQAVLVLDNASFHKATIIKETLETANITTLFLPPYSPDFNPIEHKWAQAKATRKRKQIPVTELFQNSKNHIHN